MWVSEERWNWKERDCRACRTCDILRARICAKQLCFAISISSEGLPMFGQADVLAIRDKVGAPAAPGRMWQGHERAHSRSATSWPSWSVLHRLEVS